MQKEELSALIDGESLDNNLLITLSSEQGILQKRWESYHLIRDILRGEIRDVLHSDIAARIAVSLENEKIYSLNNDISILEPQPTPQSWQKFTFWNKIKPWAGQLTQMGIAATVAFGVILGVQQYNHSDTSGLYGNELPVFNTLPVGGYASPVSYGVPPVPSDQIQQVREQQNRINAMLQDYELQRHLHVDTPKQPAAVGKTPEDATLMDKKAYSEKSAH